MILVLHERASFNPAARIVILKVIVEPAAHAQGIRARTVHSISLPDMTLFLASSEFFLPCAAERALAASTASSRVRG